MIFFIFLWFSYDFLMIVLSRCLHVFLFLSQWWFLHDFLVIFFIFLSSFHNWFSYDFLKFLCSFSYVPHFLIFLMTVLDFAFRKIKHDFHSNHMIFIILHFLHEILWKFSFIFLWFSYDFSSCSLFLMIVYDDFISIMIFLWLFFWFLIFACSYDFLMSSLIFDCSYDFFDCSSFSLWFSYDCLHVISLFFQNFFMIPPSEKII